MADALTVSITADTADLQTKLALVNAQIRATGAEVRGLAKDFLSTGDAAKLQGLDEAARKLGGLRTELGGLQGSAKGAGAALQEAGKRGSEAAEGIEHTRVVTANSTREFIVLGHEVMTGNFSRIPGSILVLTERIGGLHAILGAIASPMGLLVGTAAAIAGGFAYLAYQAYESQKAVRDVQSSLALFGNQGSLTAEEQRRWMEQLRSDLKLSASDANELTRAFGEMANRTLAEKQSLAQFTAEASKARGEKLEETIKQVTAAVNEGGPAVLKLAESWGMHLNAALTEYVEHEHTAGNISISLKAAIAEVTQEADDQYGAIMRATGSWEEYTKAIAAAGEAGEALALQLPAPQAPESAGMGGPGIVTAGQKSSAGELGGYLRKNYNLTPAQQAAVLGNAQGESGLDPNAPGGGMFQEQGERFTQLVQYAESIGKSWRDAKVQVDFFMQEVRKMAPEFMKAQSAAAGVAILVQKVEKSKDQPSDIEKRTGYAAQLQPTLESGERDLREKDQEAQEAAAATEKDAAAAHITNIRAAIAATQDDLAGLKERLRLTKELGAFEVAQAEKKTPGHTQEAAASSAEKIAAAERAVTDKTLADRLAAIELESDASRKGSAARVEDIQHEMAEIAAVHGTGVAEYQAKERELQAALRQQKDEEYREFTEKEKAKIDAVKNSPAQVAAIYDQWLAAVKTNYQQDQAEFERVQRAKSEAATKATEAQEDAQIKTLEGERKRADEAEAFDLKEAEHRQQIGKGSIADAEAKELAIVAAHDKAVEQILAAEKKLADGRVQVEAEIDNRIEQLHQQSKDRRVQIDQQGLDQIKAATDAAVKPMESAFDSIGKGLINRTMTWRQAMDKLFVTLIEDPAFKNLEKAFSSVLEGTAQGGGGVAGGGLLGGIGKFFSGTLLKSLTGGGAGAATDAGSTAVVGAVTDTGAKQIAQVVTQTAANTLTTSTQTAAITGAIVTQTGALALAANVPKPFGFSQGGLVPAFRLGGLVPSAQGGWHVPGNTLAMLHTNEMVLPPHISQGFQDMFRGGRAGAAPSGAGAAVGAGGGDNHFHFHAPVFDAAGVRRWAQQHSDALAGGISSASRSFNPRLGYSRP